MLIIDTETQPSYMRLNKGCEGLHALIITMCTSSSVISTSCVWWVILLKCTTKSVCTIQTSTTTKHILIDKAHHITSLTNLMT